MLRIISILSLFILQFAISFSFQSRGLVFEDSICVENIATIDSLEVLKENQSIIIQHVKIHRTTSSDSLQISNGKHIITGKGKYMIPGLWDARVHFAYIKELALIMFDAFLLDGITSVHDTGGKFDFVKSWKDMALANPTDAPRLMIAGSLFDGEPNVYGGSDTSHPELSGGLDTIEAVIELVDMKISEEVGLLKAYEMLTPEQFHKINELAQASGLEVAGYIPLSMDAISASTVGINSIEDMRNLEISCATNAQELWPQRREMLKNEKNLTSGDLRTSIHHAQREIAVKKYDEIRADTVLSVRKKNNTWQIPTRKSNTFFTRRYFERKDRQESYTFLSDSVGQNWMKTLKTITNSKTPEGKEAWNQWNYLMVKKIHKKGIPIMTGTDAPIAIPTPGLSLLEERAVLVEDVGLSAMVALKSATINPVNYFNIEKELASIKESMWANLLILDANPLENIQNTKSINSIIKQGKILDSDALNQISRKLQDD